MNNTALAFTSFKDEVQENEKSKIRNESSLEPNGPLVNVRDSSKVADFDSISSKETDGSLDIKDIKSASRVIRSKISQEHYKELLDERNALLDKEYETELEKKEQMRLRMLRWEIERIEDAQIGASLDKLEEFAEIQERLSRTVDDFLEGFQKGKLNHAKRSQHVRRK